MYTYIYICIYTSTQTQYLSYLYMVLTPLHFRTRPTEELQALREELEDEIIQAGGRGNAVRSGRADMVSKHWFSIVCNIFQTVGFYVVCLILFFEYVFDAFLIFTRWPSFPSCSFNTFK